MQMVVQVLAQFVMKDGSYVAITPITPATGLTTAAITNLADSSPVSQVQAVVVPVVVLLNNTGHILIYILADISTYAEGEVTNNGGSI